MHIHLDAVGGVAGDMFIAAVLDAYPSLCEGLFQAIGAAGLPAEVHCRIVEHRDHALTGRRFVVDDPHELAHRHAHSHGHEHTHDHTPFAQIRSRLLESSLKPEIAHAAVAMFTLLAQVEGKVHGMPPEEVSFHELGGWDSIADMVGAAYLIGELGASSWSVSALPLGRGRVKTAHGEIAVPSPATALLLEGFDFIDDGLEGERVTPTGAVILRHLQARSQVTAVARRLARSGTGFGTRTFPRISNVLRLLVFEEADVARSADRVAQIAFEIDDQSPEDLAIGLERLRAHPAVLDVLQMPAFGKKGRMSTHVQILALPDALDSVCDSCFSETTTIGLRYQIMGRRILSRHVASVEVGGQTLRVKVAQRPGRVTAKAESDDLNGAHGDRGARSRLRVAAEAAGLKGERE